MLDMHIFLLVFSTGLFYHKTNSTSPQFSLSVLSYDSDGGSDDEFWGVKEA